MKNTSSKSDKLEPGLYVFPTFSFYHGRFLIKGAQWTYSQQETCSPWINCIDGAMSMVDQEEKVDPNAGKATKYKIDKIFASNLNYFQNAKNEMSMSVPFCRYF